MAPTGARVTECHRVLGRLRAAESAQLRTMSGARIACAGDPVGGPLLTVQASSRRCLFGRLACLLPTVPGNGWAEVITLAAVFVIAALSTPGASPARCCCCRFRLASWARPVRRSPGQPAVQRRLHSRPLYRYWRQRQTGGCLALVLIAGTLPGAVAGPVIRVKVLPGPRVVDQVVAAVLLPLGAWLVVTRPSRPSLLVGKVAEGAGDADEWCRTVPW